MKNRLTPNVRRFRDAFIRSLRWLVPGLGVKRWFLLSLAGTTLIGVGVAILILDFYRTAPETWWLPLISAASLRFLARPLRALIFGGLGLTLITVGIWGVNRTLMRPYVQPGHAVVDTLTLHRRRRRGPKVVVIGGGNGLSTLLRGIKEYTHRITAVVTVADDGGSSGRLRREMGILPPGDIRNCLAALSNDEAMLTQLFQYRFSNAQTGLEGHSFGNLFISALSDITGSFEDAVAESGRVLSVNGRVLPSTLHNVQLIADVSLPHLVGEVRVEGESHIPEAAGKVKQIWLEPNNPPAYPRVIREILSADLIIIGPGSLYTSILPNLLVPDITKAIHASRGLKIYVCNVAAQHGETDGYSCVDHIEALERHIGSGLFDIVVSNQNYSVDSGAAVEWVVIDKDIEERYPVYRGDLVDGERPWRHDSQKLAQTIMDLLQERTGPLVE